MMSQNFYDARVEFSDNSEMFMRDSWDVFANRKDSCGFTATYNIGSFDTELEAQSHADEINGN